jgi:membrane fusion protein (multidrug efflux system)
MSSNRARARAAHVFALRPALTLGLAAVLAAGLLACGGGDSAGGPPQGQPPQASPVEVATARLDPLSVRLASVGSMQADNIVEVRPETAGKVASIPVDEGQTVARGAVLVRLDDRELAAELAAAEAAVHRNETELANLETRLQRNRGLFETGAISRQTLDDLESSHEAAAARLEEARAQRDLAARRLDKMVLRAPFAGTAGSRDVYPGDFVKEGQALFTLVDADPLRVEFTVPEQYVDRLEIGSPVTVQVRSLPGRDFAGRLSFISPRVDATSRTVSLKAEVPNPDGQLRAGQFADVELELERREDALVVPEAAIVPRGGENYVFVVDGEGKARERKVVLGQRETGRVEVRSGVAAGDRVVVAGQQRLRDGSPVQLVSGDGAASPEAAGAAAAGEEG